jgi:hypothetical protein
MNKKALKETHPREEDSLPQLMHMVGSEYNIYDLKDGE